MQSMMGDLLLLTLMRMLHADVHMEGRRGGDENTNMLVTFHHPKLRGKAAAVVDIKISKTAGSPAAAAAATAVRCELLALADEILKHAQGCSLSGIYRSGGRVICGFCDPPPPTPP